MNSQDQIFILSQPIQTGKTTLLQEWIVGKQNIGGILTPDVNGKRMLYDIANQTYSSFQLEDTAEGINIGRFVFSKVAFKKAQKILRESIKQDLDWILVDEIGRLEMDHKQGLEPAISEVIHYFNTHQTNTKLLLVIRDYLLGDAKRMYGLNDVKLLERAFFVVDENKYLISNLEKNIEKEIPNTLNPKSKISNQRPIGVVLCGGQSVRMGRDKAFITYHSKQQYAYVADMMKPFCSNVFISGNLTQQAIISQQYLFVLDNATYKNTGPMSGVLSLFEQQKDSAVLVIGCDYPHFTQADMMALIDARADGIDVVCYHNSETNFDEPLLAIYEKQCAPLLLDFYQKGNTSLQQFLKTVRTKRIGTSKPIHITSVDV
jgi:molybdopterin-guanine dinucleotide biosynthesis protein A/nucleoside-triphosphatase THEP1